MCYAETNVSLFEKDLKMFIEYCRENKLSDEQILELLKPLLKPRNLKKYFIIAAVLPILLILAGFFLMNSETVQWHLSAIGRIILIELLPFWNWQALRNEKCMIKNPFVTQKGPEIPVFDCVVCEAIENVEKVDYIDPDMLQSKYLRLDVPVIVNNGLQTWPSFQNRDFNLTSAIGNDEAVGNSLPCRLSTNTFTGAATVTRLMTNLDNFNSYFLHFQNCDFAIVKEFRKFAPKPEFFVPEISPIQYQWVLISRGYKIDKFKPIDLQEPITVIGQVRGWNIFRLIPRHNCEKECSMLDIELKVGEALVFTTLWNLEYKPSVADEENIAIILEMH